MEFKEFAKMAGVCSAGHIHNINRVRLGRPGRHSKWFCVITYSDHLHYELCNLHLIGCLPMPCLKVEVLFGAAATKCHPNFSPSVLPSLLTPSLPYT